MAVDIREVRGKTKTEAIAKATVEHGNNFMLLGEKEEKVGGFLGFGKKTEWVIRIMLRDSIYNRKVESVNSSNTLKEEVADNYEDKLISDGKELNKHKYTTETIDGSEMGERIVSMIKALKEAKLNAKDESAVRVSAKQNAENNLTLYPDIQMNSSVNNSINNSIEKSVNEKSINERILDEKLASERIENFNSFNNNYNNNYNNNNLNNKTKNNNLNNFTPIPTFNNSYNSSLFGNSALRDGGYISKNSMNSSINSIDENVKKMVQAQVKDIVKEYFENNVPNFSRNDNNFNNSYNNNFNNNYLNNKKYSYYNGGNRYETERNFINEVSDNGENIGYDENIENSEFNNDNMDAMEESFNYLRGREFPEEVLIDLREYLLTSSNARFFQSKEIIREEIEKYFLNKLILSDGINIGVKKKIIVFVGPTGVGKTTTIPKIAAQYIKSGRKVSFVTIDNYRIAAVDQLQRYASILKVPFTSASNPEALRAEIRKMDNSSLLFIDTMGRSPKGTDDIISMSKYFSTVGRFDMDIQLVMSSTAKYKDAVKILDAFKPSNYKGIILTKVDETDYLASSVCAISKTKTPITYVTHGQGVPKDISTAKKYGKNIIESLYGNLK